MLSTPRAGGAPGIIEIENVKTGERFHGNPRMLQRLEQALDRSGVGEPLTLSAERSC